MGGAPSVEDDDRFSAGAGASQTWLEVRGGVIVRLTPGPLV